MEAYWDQAGLPSQANGHSAPPHPVKFERWEKFHNLFLQLYFIFFSSPPENPLSYCVGTIRKYNLFYFCTRLSARHRRHDSCFWPQFGTFNLQSVRFFSALFLPLLFSLRERHADRPIGFIWLFFLPCAMQCFNLDCNTSSSSVPLGHIIIIETAKFAHWKLTRLLRCRYQCWAVEISKPEL